MIKEDKCDITRYNAIQPGNNGSRWNKTQHRGIVRHKEGAVMWNQWTLNHTVIDPFITSSVSTHYYYYCCLLTWSKLVWMMCFYVNRIFCLFKEKLESRKDRKKMILQLFGLDTAGSWTNEESLCLETEWMFPCLTRKKRKLTGKRLGPEERAGCQC